MAVAIAAVAQDSWPPRVLVTVTGLTVGQAVEVYRETAGGARQLVRAGAATVTDPSFLRTDAELPFGEPVSYVAVVDGGAATTSTAPVVYALPGGRVAVTDAVSGLAADVVIMAWPEATRPRRGTRYDVGGRTVAVLGQLGAPESAVEFFTDSVQAYADLVAVLEGATEGTVQVRQPGGYAGVDSYQAVMGVTTRRWSQDGTDPRRVVAVDMVEVEAWAPALEAQGTTLQDVADAYPAPLTLADLAADYATLLDLARSDMVP